MVKNKYKINEIEIPLTDKVVKLRGHLDEDYFRVFTESLETHPSLSQEEKDIIKEIISTDPNMILD